MWPAAAQLSRLDTAASECFACVDHPVCMPRKCMSVNPRQLFQPDLQFTGDVMTGSDS